MRLVLARVLAALFAASWIVFPGFGVDRPLGHLELRLAAGARGGLGPLLHRARRRRVRRRRLPAALRGAARRTARGRGARARRVGRRRPRGAARLGPRRCSRSRRSSWHGSPARSWRSWTASRGASAPMLALAALGVVPWLAYALDMWAANRDERPDSDITNGIDHYAVQGALGLALAVLPLLAALRPALTPARSRMRRDRRRVPGARVVRVAGRGRRLRPRLVGCGDGVGPRSRRRLARCMPSVARAERRSADRPARAAHSAARRRSSPSRIRSSPNSNSGFSAGSAGAMCCSACSTT